MVFFVVQRSTFIIPETDDTVFNIIKFTFDARTQSCMNWGGGGGGEGNGEEGNVSIGTIGIEVLSSLRPPARQRFLSLLLEMEQNKNNPEVTFTVLYLLCQLSKPHAKNL